MIIQNAIRVGDQIIRSTHRHDSVSLEHSSGIYRIDGGHEYFLYSFPYGCCKEFEDLRLTDSNALKTIKNKLIWGTKGKEGDEPLKYIKIKDMEKEHMEKLLFEVRPHLINPLHRTIMHMIYKEKYDKS